MPMYCAILTSVRTPAGKPKGFPTEPLSSSFLNASVRHVTERNPDMIPVKNGMDMILSVIKSVYLKKSGRNEERISGSNFNVENGLSPKIAIQ